MRKQHTARNFTRQGYYIYQDISVFFFLRSARISQFAEVSHRRHVRLCVICVLVKL